MWDDDVHLKHQTLLRDLKSTVEGLLSSQVANVWYIYGGLNRLHVDVVKIFKHGCTITQTGNESDYWRFIKGLQWLQPNTSNSSFSIDCEYRSHLPHTIKEDRASTWLYRCLENHSLSQKLSWLLSDQSHLLSCYHSKAFLCQKDYAEATLICLRAVERNQPSLISEIKPHLFLLPSKEYHRNHRRCSSFPDAHLRDNSTRKTYQSFDLTLPKCDEIKTKDTQRIVVKLRTWKSLPDMHRSSVKIATRVRHNTECRSSPVTPIRIIGNEKVSPSLLKVDYDSLQKKVPKKSTLKRPNKTQKSKRVLIDNCNIIEHTQSAPKAVTKTKVSSSAPEYSFLSFVSGEKDYTKKPKKTFIEDGGMSVLPMATGFFPRPLKGQSLTSFLMSSQFTRANAELDRENAHFNISEAVISAMEQIKCGKVCSDEHQEESDEEINQLKQRIRLRRRMKIVEEQKQTSWGGSSLLSDGKTDTTTEASPASMSSSTDTYSGSISSEENVFDLEIDKASNLSDIMELSMSMASLYSEADIMKRTREAPDGASDALSAEGVALTLISKFSEKQLPRASDLVWLVSEEDAPQALLPLPKSWPVSPDDCDELVTSLRGTMEWAPPRPQVIFTLHPIVSRNDLIAKQNYRCAGCGMRVAKQYASKFRYCNYLGRFFCTGCHSNQLSIIPARIIQNWNFKRFIVSNFSYRLLEQMYTDPLFRVFELNRKLMNNKAMKTCRMFREGLSYLKDFILTCRFADTIQDYLKNERSYLLSDPDVYSMEDLVKVKTGEMRVKFKFIAEMCSKHVYECQLCLARGFICEICKKNDLLFPWRMGSVSRCKKCGCCFHITCWKESDDLPCRRCTRFGRRRASIDNANPAP
ncbi:PREDICTED: run domain Beclin-1-interacting and cysteine-rich domain-containing protein isoform X1 [Nicrophorus vespilloides]|uniref:Run domain Beclin-1-interacting and cysteine-rich domain-containing protein isoform X1 n=1 Tax=Nicrophorus vespilloides TaxID=110193 RepID=A0ABM1M001_NICVS|nr:PREDICTED: run domain Beclin-1-interacting and cysteine-rich domain-containing protein isoform X1 [Nicrophorus vespilloides]